MRVRLVVLCLLVLTLAVADAQQRAAGDVSPLPDARRRELNDLAARLQFEI